MVTQGKQRSQLGRWIGILAAAIGGFAAISWMPYYPIWSLIYILISVMVIYALTVYGTARSQPDQDPAGTRSGQGVCEFDYVASVGRLSPENVRRARELIALYPESRSALIPILHLAQSQDGWLTPEAMGHVAELVDLSPAEVYGTASFYDMLFTEKVGRHLVSICTNLACLLNGAYELLEHAEASLGVAAGATTPDGEFTVEEVECIALCGEAPCLAVNWRFFGKMTPNGFDQLVDDLRAGRLADQVPPHGTLCRVRRQPGLLAGAQPAPEDASPYEREQRA